MSSHGYIITYFECNHIVLLSQNKTHRYIIVNNSMKNNNYVVHLKTTIQYHKFVLT